MALLLSLLSTSITATTRTERRDDVSSQANPRKQRERGDNEPERD